ncbi:MAG: chemotaxis protein CheD [Oligoflexia bacterium]|nr:chemotaxis protein CheD [Oligoflexia bacterium]MBF0364336.1 chemotaxis protein CheD [Oligoflexia bacterium]
MKTIFDSKFQKEVVLIGQGEIAVEKSNSRLISTTLGSCIAVCLFDPESLVGGMNHYMLPAPALEEECIVFSRAKYGVNSMEYLINELLKIGAVRERITAKIFGGANMFGQNSPNTSLTSVGAQNIAFAQSYLTMERISVLAKDVGGDHARKIYLDPTTGKVKLFRLRSQQMDEVLDSEVKYRKKIQSEDKHKDEESVDAKITLF